MRRFTVSALTVFCKLLGSSREGECLRHAWEGYVYKSLVRKSCCHTFIVGM